MLCTAPAGVGSHLPVAVKTEDFPEAETFGSKSTYVAKVCLEQGHADAVPVAATLASCLGFLLELAVTLCLFWHAGCAAPRFKCKLRPFSL